MGFGPSQQHLCFLFPTKPNSRASPLPRQPKSHSRSDTSRRLLPRFADRCQARLESRLFCYHLGASDATNWYTLILSFTQAQAEALIIDGLVCLWWSAKLKAPTLPDTEYPTCEPADSQADRKGTRDRAGLDLNSTAPMTVCNRIY